MVMGDMVMAVDVVVIGAGPGGCAAAFRAAELGFDVALVDANPSPGGNYLHKTCIPSQIYLDISLHLRQIESLTGKGLRVGQPKLDLQRIISRKTDITHGLAANLTDQCKQSGVLYVKGKAFFENSTTIRLKDSEVTAFTYKYAVIATGSSPTLLSEYEVSVSNRIVSHSKALEMNNIPDRLLIVGAGHTGLELANIYSSFGSKVDIVDENEQLLPYVDTDLTSHIKLVASDLCNSISLATRITKFIKTEENIQVYTQRKETDKTKTYDLVILANGRTPSSNNLGLENTLVQCNKQGFITTDSTQRTSDPNIFAVGDVTSSEMLSSIATKQGQVTAEVISGLPSAFDVRAVPCTINLNPLISWCGLTEKVAAATNIPVKIQTYTWNEHVNSRITGNTAGLTKIISSAASGRILGVGILGQGSAELINEGVLAIEMGALVEDLSLTLHGHPTYSELFAKTALDK